jgi:hypothetical protein
VTLYKLHSETRITFLSPAAKETVEAQAAEFGMSLKEMTRHLFQQAKLREAGQIQGEGGETDAQVR